MPADTRLSIGRGTGAWLEAGASGNATITTPQLSGTTWSATIGTLATNTPYEFRVSATGTGDYSDSGWSNVESATPSKIALNTPSFGTITASSSEINVAWTAIETASGYVIEWATDSDFETIVDSAIITDGDETEFVIPDLAANATYYDCTRLCQFCLFDRSKRLNATAR